MNLILQIIQILIPLIKEIEKLFPQGGAGAEKLALAQDILMTSADISGEMKDMVVNNWPKIAVWIGRLVTLFNKVGWAQEEVKPVGA